MERLKARLRLTARSLNCVEALHGAFIGLGFGVLAAFLGEVRTSTAFLLLLMLAGAALGVVPRLHRLLTYASFVVLFVLGVCLLTPVLRGPLNALTVSQPPVQADAIVVLGGGVQCGAVALESSSLARLERGLELWQAGYAPIVTVSEQSGLLGPRDCPKMSGIQQQMVARLYPQRGPQVLVLRNVTTTRDEAARARDYAQARGWQRVLLVTSPSHSGRALAIFKRAGVAAISVPALETRFDSSLPLPYDRLYALRILMYEWLSRLKAALGGTPEQ